eukprot:3600999-Amphidinium_carterae.1
METKRRRFQEQQRAFVNRESAGKGLKEEQVERKSTYLFLRALERMLVEAGVGSIVTFTPLPCENPLSWRSICISGDQEGVLA